MTLSQGVSSAVCVQRLPYPARGTGASVSEMPALTPELWFAQRKPARPGAACTWPVPLPGTRGQAALRLPALSEHSRALPRGSRRDGGGAYRCTAAQGWFLSAPEQRLGLLRLRKGNSGASVGGRG